MATQALRFGAALAGVIALGGFVSQAQAQGPRGPGNPFFRPNPSFPISGTLSGGFAVGGAGYVPGSSLPSGGYSYLYNVGSSYGSSGVPSYASGTATLSTTPGVGWGNVTPGYDPFYSDPYLPNPSAAGGYLRGQADLTAAVGNFMVTGQRARLVQEEANRSQIDTRRRIWEEARWERMNTIFTEDYRAEMIKTEQRRARLEPPLNEIWSGRTLNVLLKADGDLQAKKFRGPDVPIHEDLLKHINLTSGANGNIGLFKNELQWPLPLQSSEFADPLKSLNQRIPDAVAQAKVGTVASGALKDIQKDVQNLHDTLLRNVGEMPPSDYIEAKRYLNMLSEAVRALGDPTATHYLTGKWAAKGKNVAELIDNLRGNGLEFAPAAPGDEASYRALYHALQAYDAGISQQLTSVPTPVPGSGDR